MQTLNRIIKVDGYKGIWTDTYGSKTDTPEMIVAARMKLRMDLRQTEKDTSLTSDGIAKGTLLPVDASVYICDGYYIALDGDWDHATQPKLYRFTGISVTQGTDSVILEVEIPNTAVPAILEAVDKAETLTVKIEIGGYNGDNGAECAEFAIQSEIILRNRIFRGGEVPESVANDPVYLNSAQVNALIAAAVAKATQSTTPGPANTLSIGTVTEGDTSAANITGTSPNQTLNLVLKPGSQGNPGPANTLTIGTVTEGDTPAANITGTAPAQTLNLVLKTGAKGDKGDKGNGIEYDKSGLVSEKAVYDDEAAGFRFAATVTDSVAKTSTLYIWEKLSATHADWSVPLAFTIFEREKETAILKPIEFAAPTANKKYIYFDMSAYPKATVVAVCIDTAAGELMLPYPSPEGITKILKAANGTVYIYFGALVPAYATGRIYLSQMVGLTTAAVDPDIPTPVSGSMLYGYITPAVAGAITSVTQITSEILAAAVTAGTMTEAAPATLGKTSLGTIPAGAWTVALIPSAAAYVATKDNGIGGKVAFALNNGATGTGANGTAVTIGSTEYKVYGEFQLVTAEQSIYIDEEE